MSWRRRSLGRGRWNEQLSVSHPRFGSAGATTGPTCVSQEAKPEPATVEGEVGGEVEAGEGAEEAGYGSTLLVVIGILDDIEEQSNVAGWIHASSLWRPPHTPAHLAGDQAGDLISKGRARRFLRARPLHSKPQPRTRTSLIPLRKRVHCRRSHAHGYRRTRGQGVRPANWYTPTWSAEGRTRWGNWGSGLCMG
jgi:hypothetical protein